MQNWNLSVDGFMSVEVVLFWPFTEDEIVNNVTIAAEINKWQDTIWKNQRNIKNHWH